MYCQKCGKLLGENDVFCSGCGERINKPQDTQQVNTETYTEDLKPSKGKKPYIIGGAVALLTAATVSGAVFIPQLLKSSGENNDYEEAETQTESEIMVDDATEQIGDTSVPESEIVEEQEVQEQPVLPEQPSAAELLKQAKMKSAYADLLAKVAEGLTLPDDETGAYGSYDFINYNLSNENVFAITDVDNDGIEELLIYIGAGEFDDHIFYLYDYEEMQQKDYLPEIASVVPFFYPNGIATEYDLYNNSYGDYLQPYTIYSYNSETHIYDAIGWVESWSKDRNDYQFPYNADLDGDGNVIYIKMLNQEPAYIDNTEYDNWFSTYISNNTNPLSISYQKICPENYASYIKDYRDLCVSNMQQGRDSAIVDIGELLWMQDGDMSTIDNYLQNSFGVQLVEVEENFDYEVCGYVNQSMVFGQSTQEAPMIEYSDTALPNLYCFGVCPGMSQEDAIHSLKNYGMWKEDQYEFEGCDWISYVTGLACPRVYAELVIQNGYVQKIEIILGSRFVG